MERKLVEEYDKRQKSLKHKRKKDTSQAPGSKVKQKKTQEPEFIQPSTSYRDRAKERREGLNKDFELDPDDLRISNPVSENPQLGDDDQEISEDERRRQQIEESKYLGGDIEHTHLVKGLDFALLEKVKNEQKLAKSLSNNRDDRRDLSLGNPGSDSEEEEFRNEAIIAASLSTGSKRQLVDIEKLRKGQSTELIPCRYALTRRILNVLEEKWPERSELFLPGRMSYIIPIDDDADDSSVTTILRSKADVLIQDDGGGINESDLALDQLINILARIRKGETNATASKKQGTWERDDELNDYGY